MMENATWNSVGPQKMVLHGKNEVLIMPGKIWHKLEVMWDEEGNWEVGFDPSIPENQHKAELLADLLQKHRAQHAQLRIPHR